MAIPSFIAWDTEGGTFADGNHRTTFIANSRGDELAEATGIDRAKAYDTLIPWLYANSSKYKKCVHVWYFFSYDVTMLMLGLPLETLKKIVSDDQTWTVISTTSGNYRLKYMAKRRLYLQKQIKTDAEIEAKLAECRDMGEPMPSGYGWNGVTFFDISSMYQMSFLNAIEKNLHLTDAERKIIAEGKSARNAYAELAQETIDYCRAELKLLVRLAEDLAKNIEAKGLKITNWSSPGAIATAVFKEQKFFDFLSPAKRYHAKTGEATPLGYAVRCAMKGARIETIRYGTSDGCHDYDINSAYPFFMSELPDLSDNGGKWVWYPPTGQKKLTLDMLGEFSLVRVNLECAKANFYPFAHRDAKHGITYPRIYRGWLHAHELREALRWTHIQYEILEAYDFCRADNGARPFRDFIRAEFQNRKRHKAEKNGIEKVEKLALNSLYGKMAQQVGAKFADGRIYQPPTQDLFAAGYITSRCRSHIYAMGMMMPDAVISFATDGITFSKPVPGVKTGDGLGEWEYKHWDGKCHFLMAGCYTLTMADDSAHKIGTRGMRTPMDYRAWMAVVESHWARGENCIVVGSRCFYNTKLALVRKEWESKVGNWEELTRTVKITCIGDKRLSSGVEIRSAVDRLVETKPSSLAALAGGESHPCPYRYDLVGEELEDKTVNDALDPWA